MSLGDGFEIQEVFESAVTIVRNLPKEGPIKPSDELKLKLYAYFKQATHGPNDTSKPRFYQIVESYKWDAWRKLGEMPREEAMLNYIGELKQVMDTIPREETNDDDSKHFEDVLGKRFYDYWFKQWQQIDQLTGSQSSQAKYSSYSSASSTVVARTMSQEPNHLHGPKSNDTQSNSSSGDSSVSMLEDTSQATAICEANQGGYKTPTSVDQLQASIAGPMSDQFALAVLRLQHGLEETNSRLYSLEMQLKQSMDSIRLLELASDRQTNTKSLLSNDKRKRVGKTNRLLNFVSQVGTIHWFYLSYPVVVYFLMRLLFDRRRRLGRDNLRN